MENKYNVGGWVEIQYTGQHCYGWELPYDKTIIVEIIKYKSTMFRRVSGDWENIGKKDGRRWTTFITDKGEYLSFGTSKQDYILRKINKPEIQYEVYG